MTAPRWLFSSESVTEGHPDKFCDQISDAVLDAVYEQDPLGRVACETAATADLVLVTGEITTSARLDIATIVRDAIRSVGYTQAAHGLDADAGVTGRKIMVDTYGGMARHGGGCFSGKDPTKVDRSGAYAARHVAKNVVAAGPAERCEIQIAYAIGVARPVSLMVECFGSNRIPARRLLRLIEEHFDLRPGAIIRDLRLRRPIYRPTACYGHFGRTDIDAPWEQTDKAAALRAAAGPPAGAS